MALPALSGNDMPARRAAPAYRRSACPYAADASMTRLQSPLSAPADLSSVKHSGVRHGPAPRLPADIKVKRRSAECQSDPRAHSEPAEFLAVRRRFFRPSQLRGENPMQALWCGAAYYGLARPRRGVPIRAAQSTTPVIESALPWDLIISTAEMRSVPRCAWYEPLESQG